jgi:hypothetical protein
LFGTFRVVSQFGYFIGGFAPQLLQSASLFAEIVNINSVGLVNVTQRPKVAILREQGVNGQIEMAAAFDKAGFEAIDVHMSDILTGRLSLSAFSGTPKAKLLVRLKKVSNSSLVRGL